MSDSKKPPYVSRIDIGNAYRKVKYDLRNEVRHFSKIIEFEENLDGNLERIYQDLQVDFAELVRAAEAGGWTVRGKSSSSIGGEDSTGVHDSDQFAEWRRHSISQSGTTSIDFRLIEDCSIYFHIIATLWIMKVGDKFEGRLGSESYGNRLKRNLNGHFDKVGKGTFEYWQTRYSNWQSEALSSARSALSTGGHVIFATADVSSFYPRIDASFLQKESFQSRIGVILDSDQSNLQNAYLGLIEKWAMGIPWSNASSPLGLPVGMSASSVVANLALFELDQLFSEKIPSIFYGRYVDDIILVLPWSGEPTSRQEFWSQIVAESDGLLTHATRDNSPGIQFSTNYLNQSDVFFGNKKNKTWFLQSSTGIDLIDEIRDGLRQRTSEWRRPLASIRAEHAGSRRALEARDARGDRAYNLRDADSITVKRQGISIAIRDLQMLVSNTTPPFDAESTHAALETTEYARRLIVQSTTPMTFFEIEKSLDRIIQLAIMVAPTDLLSLIVDRCEALITSVEAANNISISGYSGAGLNQHRERVSSEWSKLLVESVETSIARHTIGTDIPGLRGVEHLARHVGVTPDTLTSRLITLRDKLLIHDLSSISYVETVSSRSAETVAETKRSAWPQPERLLRATRSLKRLLDPSQELEGFEATAIPLLFPIHPIRTRDIYRILGNRGAEADSELKSKEIRSALGAFSGNIRVPYVTRIPNTEHVRVRGEQARQQVNVALAMLEVDEENISRALTGSPNHSIHRKQKILDLLNRIIDSPKSWKIDYLLLPEASIPEPWFDEMAQVCARSGISLIAGLEHQPRGSGEFVNQVRVSFMAPRSRHVYITRTQDKQRPAVPELKAFETLQQKLGMKFRLIQDVPWTAPPVYQHGDLSLGMLICSEVTNISYRAHFRGKIDVLMLPVWNRDIGSFTSIIEASALDLHAYVAQANAKRYGQTRLRAPGKLRHQRDVVRLQGGTLDYFVVGSIEHRKLYEFQESALLPTLPNDSDAFKPVPDGFTIQRPRKPPMSAWPRS